ncbi:hypothetical protein DFH08DRAFT_815621 [Mycena albidolilacea]|uniref:Uncharacterized protein n=1 Tax=Mycena albidolilacea TaxID=1033008 RepID=A0AAD7EIT2_9AGAR|nr:hypothetical protein DFH08DRAFT_815621 [Mycena albidolilacea]
MRALALFFLLLMVWVCPYPCSEPFDTKAGLSLHQNVCEYVNTHNTKMDAVLTARNERKRCKQKEAAAMAAAATVTALQLGPDPKPDILQDLGLAADEEMPY